MEGVTARAATAGRPDRGPGAVVVLRRLVDRGGEIRVVHVKVVQGRDLAGGRELVFEAVRVVGDDPQLRATASDGRHIADRIVFGVVGQPVTDRTAVSVAARPVVGAGRPSRIGRVLWVVAGRNRSVVDDATAQRLVSDLVDADVVTLVPEDQVLVHEPSGTAFDSSTQLAVFHRGWTAGRDGSRSAGPQ